MKLEAIIGTLEIKKPYMSQSVTPINKAESIAIDKFSACFVFQVLYTWGKKEAVVKNAATRPNVSIQFIFFRRSLYSSQRESSVNPSTKVLGGILSASEIVLALTENNTLFSFMSMIPILTLS